MQNNYFKILGLHVIIGIVIYYSRAIGDLYFFSMVVYLFYRITNAPQSLKPYEVVMACTYVLASEVILRMTNSSLFYEASKYLVIIFCLMGILYKGFQARALLYLFYIVLLIPGIYVSLYLLDISANIRKAVAFNLSGPVCLGVSAMFCYGVSITRKQLGQIINFGIYPLVSTLVYIVMFNPDVSEVITGTGSNYAASGGFGPNQVATVLGLGAFFMTVKFFYYSKTPSERYLDLGLLVLFSFRAIVTFSRGGVFTAIIMMAFFIYLQYRKMDKKNKTKMLVSVFLFLGMAAATWVYSTIETNGFIEKRYANQNARGIEKEDITTGRGALFAREVAEFLENPLFGVGVGRIKDIRFQKTGIHAASHNEMSRIISEHGLLGILAFSILLLAPLFFRFGDRSNVLFFSFYFFWLLTINHSAMRIAAPAFIYGLSLIHVTNDKPRLHRQQAEK